MKYAFISTLILLLSTFTYAQNKKASKLSPEQVIEQVFDGFSEGNVSKIENVATSDFKILEHGEIWTIDTLRTRLARKRPADFKRINSFEFFQREVTDKMAFVSYHNRADVHANNQDRVVKWLESAVFVKENGEWKVKMLHSTRVEQK